ncbi:zinc finger CCHC domain-containing 3-like [Paramuricea clavata]|uniref:Zinc finger CCHC domain-containing 3-like n=1 Tax=Paramuricea clavata TaxID=317549 RepID=A0A6S7JUR7_PARCT|nr:zinc finger CCHC domain-containing 3-like [Paramuricea clavata]
MKIPYANRTVDIDLPVVAGQPRLTVKSVMDEFLGQMPDNFSTLLEAFVLLSPRRVRVTCRSALAMEEFCHSGLTFRDAPIDVRPCKSAKWVNITRLSYGVSAEVITAALKPFGKVLQVKMDTYHNVYVGIRNVLMEITQPIPSRLLIAGHWCNAFYVGQVPTCFSCHKTGHGSRDCPAKRVINPPIRGNNVANLAPALVVNADVVPENNNIPVNPAVDVPPARGEILDQPDPVRVPSPLHHGETHNLQPNSPAVNPSVIAPSPAYAAVVKATIDDASQAEVDASSEEEDPFYDAGDAPPSNKRDHSDSDSSANSGHHHDKRGKAIIVETVKTQIFSPNMFAALPDEAADHDDDDEVIPPTPKQQNPPATNPSDATGDDLIVPPSPVAASVIPSSKVVPQWSDEYDGDADFSDDDTSSVTDSKKNAPLDPAFVDEPQESVMDHTPLDSPLTLITPNLPRANLSSQTSSYELDPLTLAVSSKKTKPAPVCGTSKKSLSKGGL